MYSDLPTFFLIKGVLCESYSKNVKYRRSGLVAGLAQYKYKI